MGYYDKYKNDIKTIAGIYIECKKTHTYNKYMKKNLEVINLVFAHKMACAEIKKQGNTFGEEPNERYPRFKNKTLAYLNEYSHAEDPSNLEKIYYNELKGDKFEEKEVYGGKKRKYKRKTNKRKTNKRKTNKRKTNKKRTKK